MSRRGVIALALAVCACNSREPAHDDELDGAKQQVHRFFDALAHADCATLGSLLPVANEPAACAKLLHEWNEDLRIKLVDVPSAERDGRDRRAIIVRTTVLKHDVQETMLVRVTHEQGTWHLVL